MSSVHHYLYEVTLTLNRLSLAISFPCDVTLSLKRGGKKYALKQNYPLDTTKFKCDFQQATIVYTFVATREGNSFFQEKNVVSLILVTPKGNKSAGHFEICPTNMLATTLDPPELIDQKSILEKCPDKQASMRYNIKLKRVKELSEEEYRAEKLANPDMSMTDGDMSMISNLNTNPAGNTSAVQNMSKILPPSQPNPPAAASLPKATLPTSSPKPPPSNPPASKPQYNPYLATIPEEAQKEGGSVLLQQPDGHDHGSQHNDSKDLLKRNRSGSKERPKGNITIKQPGQQTKPPQPLAPEFPESYSTAGSTATGKNPEITPFTPTSTQPLRKDAPQQPPRPADQTISSADPMQVAQLKTQINTLNMQMDELREEHSKSAKAKDKLLKDKDAEISSLLASLRSAEQKGIEGIRYKEEVQRLTEQIDVIKRGQGDKHPDSIRLAQISKEFTTLQSSLDKANEQVGVLEREVKLRGEENERLKAKILELGKIQSTKESEIRKEAEVKYSEIREALKKAESDRVDFLLLIGKV